MAATEPLLDWHPLLQLQHANFQLREENRELHWQVRELLEWKARAVRFMVTLAPKRRRAQREVRHATQLQQQLGAVEHTLQERSALEETTHLLEHKLELLKERNATLERDKQTLTSECDVQTQHSDALCEQLHAVRDAFRTHLDELVSVREETDASGGDTIVSPVSHKPLHNASNNVRGAAVRVDAPADGSAADDDDACRTDPSASGDSTAHTTHIVQEQQQQQQQQQQQETAHYEAQCIELEQLRAQVKSTQQQQQQQRRRSSTTATHTDANPTYTDAVDETGTSDSDASADTDAFAPHATDTPAHTTQRRQTADRRHMRCNEHSHSHAHVGDCVRLLVTEVRQYLRLVRVEIKKKFGYVPEAIAHAERWSRILDALDVLERHVRPTCVAIASS